ncbi:putative sugar O-methyltransferase [Actinospica durhamensis]|nr:putative sugar O-methyltransferase [Actinospica durhamensis]
MPHKYGPSQLRMRHNDVHVTAEAARELDSFKSQPINFKIGFWDPSVNGVRYLKALTYNLAAGLSAESRARLRRISNRNIGEPITVKYAGDAVCMDYVQAVLELEFITAGFNPDGRRILEIGAGYGRACHTMLSNHDVAAYYIVDLENSLTLSSGYLEKVLDADQFAKVHFLTIDEVDELPDSERFDLGVGVNAFAEMTVDTVRNYLAFIDKRCDHFYVKDPVGKYLDGSLDGHSEGREVVELALTTGMLQDVIDVHDSEAVAAHARNFVSAYQPGAAWRCSADGWAAPWSFYWQALYKNERPAA